MTAIHPATAANPAPGAPPDPVIAPLRADVEILPGPAEADGSPTYLLHDPVAGSYDRLEWPDFEIVRRLARPIRFSGLLERLRRETTVRTTPEGVARACLALQQNGLLQGGTVGDPATFEAAVRARRTHPLAWLLKHYLYFRVPLIRPDAFLARTAWAFRFWTGRLAVTAHVAAGLAGLMLILPRLDEFVGGLSRFWSWRGAAAFAVAGTIVKAAHEFSHAYRAKLEGVGVRAMGIAFMVMWPLPYSDVTDAWRLPDRRRRLRIAVAGMWTELAIAGWALLGWALSPPGVLRDVCWILSSASLATTLLTNLNPGMRFDGYYLLSDLLGIDNLQSRAFRYFRAWYRRVFLGMRTETPETRWSAGQKAGAVLYTAYAWAYRAGLYFGIAIIVYRTFPKAIGITLFAVEAVYFLVRPAVNEAIGLWRWRGGLTMNARLAATVLVLGGFLFWIAWPLPRRIALPAVAVPGSSQTVYAPEGGIVGEIRVARGDLVLAGDVLAVLSAPDMEMDLRRRVLAVERAEAEYDRLAAGSGDRGRLAERAADVERRKAEVAAVRNRLAALVLVAQADGVVAEWDESLRAGTPVARRAVLGRVVGGGRPRVTAYVAEAYAEEAVVGGAGWFAADSGGRWRARVTRVASARTETLSEVVLADTAGGEIRTLPDSSGGGAARPAGSVYRVEAELEGELGDLRAEQRGRLWLTTRPRSRAADGWRWFLHLIERESGF